MLPFGYVLVGVLGGAIVYYALQGAKSAQRRIGALALLTYGLFGLAYGASEKSSLIMFIAAVLAVMGLELSVREWREETIRRISEKTPENATRE